MATPVAESPVVTLWNSALGHSIRDLAVSAGASLLLILLDALSNVHLTGQWATFAIFIPVIVTAVKAYFHVKDPNLPNLPTTLAG